MEKCGSQVQRKEGRSQAEAVVWAGLGRCISAALFLEHFAAVISEATQ